MKRETQNLTNMKFGKLTVIKRVKRFTKNNNPYYVWQCICDCQLCKSEDKREYVYNYTYDLIDGKVISCGCLISERNKQIFQKYNEYDLSGDYGIGYLENGEEFYFDLEDYDKIKNKYWNTDKDGYIISMVNKKSNNLSIDKYIISRVVMSYNGTNKIDHINHDLKDNRKSNLRIVTTSQNGMNRCIGINNTSGYVGVHQLPSGNWKARIQYNGNRINLGVFKNKEDAIKARKEAEEKYFGEYSLNNSMKNSN